MLKTVRIILALFSISAMVALFLNAAGWAGQHLDWLAKIQFMPALLSANIIAFLFLIVLTLLVGRLYCSVICPLGIMQDVIIRIRKWTASKTKRKVGLYKYLPPKAFVRRGILILFLIVVLLGLLNVAAVSLASFIEPYSEFGRIVTAFGTPVYDGVNNWLADKSAADGSYTFVTINRVTSTMIFIIASVTFVVVALFAWFTGRGYCNEICPVGTILGFLSRYSWLKPVINSEICNGCHSCERHCKSKCIDSANKAIDYSRCVDCMDCIGVCRQGAIKFRHPSKKEASRKFSNIAYVKPSKPARETAVDKSRRAFLTTSGILTGVAVAKAAEKTVGKVTDGGLTPLKDKKPHARKLRMVPPGAISQAHINQHCVGCQLCIEACPNGLLSPSTDLATLMQPVMEYTNDYCHPECTACSNVCPAGVFHPLDEVAKSSWKIGTAVVNLDACLSANGTDSCGNCERHCPAGAITMAQVSETDSRLMPVVNENACVGCCACEYNCPVGSVASMKDDMAAIYVEGLKEQHSI